MFTLANLQLFIHYIEHQTSRKSITNVLRTFLNHQDISFCSFLLQNTRVSFAYRANNGRDLIIATVEDLQYAKVNRKLINISETTIVHSVSWCCLNANNSNIKRCLMRKSVYAYSPWQGREMKIFDILRCFGKTERFEENLTHD